MPAMIQSPARIDNTTRELSRDLLGAQNLQRFAMALPKGQDERRFAHSLVAAIERNPDLIYKCEPASLALAAIEAAHLGLEVSGARGLAYIVPFKGKAVLIPGYKGMIHLAVQSGRISKCWARVVYDGEDFGEEAGSEPKLVHRPSLSRPTRGDGTPDTDKIVAAYAVVKFPNGDTQFEVVPRAELDKVQKGSPSRNGPWKTHPDRMMVKTAIRRLFQQVGFGDDRIARAVQLDDVQEAGKAQDLGAALTGAQRQAAANLGEAWGDRAHRAATHDATESPRTHDLPPPPMDELPTGAQVRKEWDAWVGGDSKRGRIRAAVYNLHGVDSKTLGDAPPDAVEAVMLGLRDAQTEHGA